MIDFDRWKIDIGALRYFGILTFEDRPDIMAHNETLYAGGTIMTRARDHEFADALAKLINDFEQLGMSRSAIASLLQAKVEILSLSVSHASKKNG